MVRGGTNPNMSFSAQVGTLRPDNPAPLYLQLQSLLRDAIQRNVHTQDDAIPAERELAVGLVIGCALDVQTSNSAELVRGISGLEKLLTAIKQLSRVFGWPDDSENGDDGTEHDDTRH